MTKKVLISLDELKEICSDAFMTGVNHSDRKNPEPGEFVADWFNVQPTAVETINDRVIYINPYYTTIRIPIGSYVEFLGGGGGSGGKGLSKIESAHSGE